MKRHLLGLMIFSSIVFSAIVINRILVKTSEFVFVPATETENWEKTSCFKKKQTRIYTETVTVERRAESPVVTQAIFNDRTKQISISLHFEPVNYEVGSTPIRLTYFREEAGKMKLIKPEFITMPAQGFDSNNGTLAASVVASYEWLDNLDFTDNLYVQAETVPAYGKARTAPEFDAGKAMAVTRLVGK